MLNRSLYTRRWLPNPRRFVLLKSRAFSSVVERFVHIEEVAGPIPATRTINMLDKSALLLNVIQELEARAAKLADAARATREEVVRAPTPMESHSDKTRFEMQLAHGHQQEMILKYERAIAALEVFTFPKEFHEVALGVLVTVERSGKAMRYLLLPEGNGLAVGSGSDACTVITPGSPLGACLMGGKVGTRATVDTGRGSYELVVRSIE